MASQQNTALLGLGALGIAAPRIWPTGSEATAGDNNAFADPNVIDSRSNPYSTPQGLGANNVFGQNPTNPSKI
jgi:hypothetical protein